MANESDNRRNQIINREKAKKGLRGKINAFCASCIYDPFGSEGTWRKQVEDCTSVNCPLYEVRPTSKPSVKYPI